MYIVLKRLNDMLNKLKKNYFENKKYLFQQPDNLIALYYNFIANHRADKRYKLLVELINDIENKNSDTKNNNDTGINNG